MIFVNDPNSGIIMFSTRSNLDYICQRDVEIFCDGTFKYCPKHFYQLYTFPGFKNGQQVPSIFFLLPAKSTQTYKQMFQHFVNVCRSNGLDLQISAIHLDFEEAVNDAVK